MTYQRVIPRDLFNEANLLKCMGHLTLLADRYSQLVVDFMPSMRSHGFMVEQYQSDGRFWVSNIHVHMHGLPVCCYVPLNSRTRYPMWMELLEGDAEPVKVFTEDGQMTDEFSEWLLTRPKMENGK